MNEGREKGKSKKDRKEKEIKGERKKQVSEVRKRG